MRLTRPLLLASAAALTSGLLVASPTHASDVTTTIDGVSYSANDTFPSFGARVTGYSGAAFILTIPESVEISSTNYLV